jgi:hypothetical protein
VAEIVPAHARQPRVGEEPLELAREFDAVESGATGRSPYEVVRTLLPSGACAEAILALALTLSPQCCQRAGGDRQRPA